MILGSLLWIQVPQWDDNWEKCAVDVPDAACHWYVAAPDNTFGKGFSWKNAPWFDANGLKDVSKIKKSTVLEAYKIEIIYFFFFVKVKYKFV